MQAGNYALVLTGEVLPGHAPEKVWPALAAYFRMDPDRFEKQLRARAPIAIKHDDDLGKLQTLQAGAAAVGAACEICAPDGRSALFVLLDGTPRGPIPRVLVEERIDHGLWPATVRIAEVGSRQWKAYRELDAAAAPLAPPVAEPLPEKPFHRGDIAVTPVPRSVQATSPALPAALPNDPAVEAGFWRRCAAALIDGLLLGAAFAALSATLFTALPLAVSIGGRGGLAVLPGLVAGFGLFSLVGQWLYFALFEGSRLQATPGKLAMGIKVVDERGRRIGFAHASGRFIGKILSGALFGIGYLLPAFSDRKRALHDMVANTLVVFRDVEFGRQLPTGKPPMPWYGWAVNLLVLLGVPLVAAALAAVLLFGL